MAESVELLLDLQRGRWAPACMHGASGDRLILRRKLGGSRHAGTMDHYDATDLRF